MVRLQVQTVMPLSMTQQLHMPPASMVHRFWTMLHASLSSVLQVSRRPPWHFSTRNVQRGTMVQLVPTDMPVGAPTGDVPNPETPSPGNPVPVRSIIMVLDIDRTPFWPRQARR
jgi:hypothetical protein